MKNEYGVDIEVQRIITNLLGMFDAYCQEHNLKYYLHAGTLLGALRHHGIIPWDDDIDVSMPRKDYERLLSLQEKEPFPEPFFLASYKTIKDSSYPYQWAKLEDKRTKIKETIFPNGRKDAGIFIDIFPLDHIGNDEKAQRKEVHHCIAYKIFLLAYYDYKDPRAYLRWFWKLTKFMLKIFYRTGNDLHRKADKVFANADGNTDWITDLWGWDMQGITPTLWLDDGRGIRKEMFSGKTYPVPIESEKVLVHTYGDWQKFPPEEQRKAAHGYEYEIEPDITLDYI